MASLLLQRLLSGPIVRSVRCYFIADMLKEEHIKNVQRCDWGGQINVELYVPEKISMKQW